MEVHVAAKVIKFPLKGKVSKKHPCPHIRPVPYKYRTMTEEVQADSLPGYSLVLTEMICLDCGAEVKAGAC